MLRELENTNDVIELSFKVKMKACEVDLVMHIFFANNEVFLHALDKAIKYLCCVVLGIVKRGEGL